MRLHGDHDRLRGRRMVGFDGLPLWTPDGTRVTYSSSPTGSTNTLFWINANGSGHPEPLVERGVLGNEGATSWSPDGRVLAYYENAQGGADVFTVKSGERPVKLMETPRPARHGGTFAASLRPDLSH